MASLEGLLRVGSPMGGLRTLDDVPIDEMVCVGLPRPDGCSAIEVWMCGGLGDASACAP
jgi:hypothetical protein